MNKKRITTLSLSQRPEASLRPTRMGILESFLYYKRVQGLSDRTIQDYTKLVNHFFKCHPNAWAETNKVNEEKLKSDLFEYLSQFEGTRMTHDSLRGRLDKYSNILEIKIRPYNLRHAFALIISTPLCSHNFLNICPISALIFPYITCLLYFGAKTI